MKYPQFFALALGCFGVLDVVAQTTFDGTDNLANLQKQYIIRIDIANGNVLLPYKKKLVTDSDTSADFRRTVMDFTNQNKEFKVDSLKRANRNYLISKRMYSPKVGSMVRVIYENVPQNYDITTNIEMNNKNLEYAGMAQNYLNSQNDALKNRLEKDNLIKALEEKNKSDSLQYKVDVDTEKGKTEKKISDITSEVDSILKVNRNSLITDILKQLDAKKGNNQTVKIDISKTVTDLKNRLKLSDLPLDTAAKKILESYLNDATNSFSDSINKLLTAHLLGSDKVYNAITKTYDELNAKTDSMGKLLQKRIDTIYQAQIKSADTLRRQLFETQKNLLNFAKPTTITPQPFQVYNTDVTHIIYTITKGTTENAKVEKREIILKNKGGFKLDFSTGVVGTGLVDDNFKVVSDSANATTASLVNENKGNFTVGFGLFAHAYVRSGGRLNVALSAGLMVNSSNQNINYTTGISIPMGLEERLILNAGIVYGKVKRLAAGYTEASSVQNRLLLNTNGGSVATVEKWDNSWYLGVSFNIGSISANNKYAFKL